MSGRDAAEDAQDAEEWQREQALLKKKLDDKKAREAGANGGGGDGQSAPVKPRKKKLLNGTNIEYRYPSGSVYVGGFKDGKLHGYGRYHYHPSNDIYEGEWVTDMKHGQGTYTYDCGDRYVGEWRTGKKHGKGTYAFASGDEYVGSWKEDRIHGYGVFTIARNNNRYEGNWEESYRHGFGVLRCGNGDLYEGNWSRGKEDGQGVLTYANGNRYAGDWRAGQMDGKGIMQETGQKFTVEHIAGYLIAKVLVPDEGAVDPEWNKANKLYEDYLAKQKKTGGEGEGGGGDAATAAELTKMKVERDMWEAKYREAVATAGAPADVDAEDENDAKLTNVDELRARLASVKGQRNTEKHRADNADARVKQTESQVQELEFKCKNVDELQAENEKLKKEGGGGGGGGTGGVPQAEHDKLQRRVVELERELQKKDAAAAPPADGAASELPTNPAEMRVKLELLDGEVRMLRSVRDDLQRARENNLDLQKQVMTLETGKEEMMKEMTVMRQRMAHNNSEEAEARQRREQELNKEISEMRQQLQDEKVKASTNEEAARKAKGRLKETEGYAKRCQELEVELSQLKTNRAGTAEKASDELEALRAKNAEIMLELEELRLTRTAAPAAAAAVAAGGASAAEIKELQTKYDSAHSDYKKEKKKHKKASNERDELQGKLASATKDLSRAQRSVAALVDGKVNVVARMRPLTTTEADTGHQPVVAIGADGASLSFRNQPHPFDACFPAEARTDAIVDELRDVLRAPANGFNACVLTYGPMASGKTHLTQQLAPLAIAELFKACEATVKVNPSLSASVESTCIELTNEGVFDLNNPASTGTDLRPMKNAFGAVVVEGSIATKLASARDAAVDFSGALGRRRKPRSHILYTLHVRLQHKVNDSVLYGKLTFADLAGLGALGDQSDIESAKYINNGMSAFTRVADALAVLGNTAVPYRDDALTEYLSDALGGNSRLAVLAVFAPGSEDTADTAGRALATAAALRKVQNNAMRQFESPDVVRLRTIVASLQSPEEAAPKLTEIVSLRE